MSSPDSVPALAYQIPRLALDYRFSSFTLGGSLGFFSGSSSEEDPDGEVDSGPDLTLFALTARAGVVFSLGRRFFLWPKAGVAYYAFSESRTDSDGQEESSAVGGLGIGLEGALGYRVLPSVALTAALSADFTLAGSVEEDPAPEAAPDVTSSARSIGLGLGVAVTF